MRVILRDMRTGFFLDSSSQWTRELDKARCFRHSAEAMDHALRNSIKDVEVLLAFEQPPNLVVLPIT
jgi:hypothetical protein